MTKEPVKDGRDAIDILIDLDSLLDFRIATVSRLNDEFASTLFSEEYLNRYHDGKFFEEAGGIPAEQYNEEYRKRNAEYLIGAYPTAIYWYLGRKITDHMLHNDQPGGHRYVRLTINVYPFEFSEEALSMLENSVSIYLDSKIDIRTINEPITALTPSNIRSRFTDVFMYDFNTWIQTHLVELMNSSMLPVAIWTPAIKRGTELTAEQKADIQNEWKDNTNPFEHTRAWLMDNVQLNYMDVKHFSVELKKYPVGVI